MQILETHASNDKEAAELAATYLDVEPDLVDVELYKKGSSGFLGFGEKEPAIYHVIATEGKTPFQVVVKGVVATLLHNMGYKAKFVRFETLEEDGKLYVELASPQAGYIIGKKGRTLESLQFLANLMIEQFTENAPRLLLDIENYRHRRARHLEDLAKRIASQVVRSGKSKLLDPLNPYERRLIHMALQDNKNVDTESEGNGVYKRVRIFSTGKPRGGGRNRDNSKKDQNFNQINEAEENAVIEDPPMPESSENPEAVSFDSQQ